MDEIESQIAALRQRADRMARNWSHGAEKAALDAADRCFRNAEAAWTGADHSEAALQRELGIRMIEVVEAGRKVKAALEEIARPIKK